MFRFIVLLAALLIIDEYTLRLRRRYLARRAIRQVERKAQRLRRRAISEYQYKRRMWHEARVRAALAPLFGTAARGWLWFLCVLVTFLGAVLIGAYLIPSPLHPEERRLAEVGAGAAGALFWVLVIWAVLKRRGQIMRARRSIAPRSISPNPPQ